MRKAFILVVSVFLFSTGVGAIDVSVSVNPSDTLWLSQDFDIQTICGEASETGHSVFINNISRGGNMAPAGEDSQLVYVRDGNKYVLSGQTVRSFLEDRFGYTPGTYTFFTTCDKGNGTGIAKHSWTVESLTADIEDDPDRTYFAGQEHNLSLTLKKEGAGSPVIIGADSSPQPTFTASIDGSTVEVSSYYNAERSQWVLNMPVPDDPGTYALTVTASHDGASTSRTREITVQDTLMFDVDVSKNRASAGQTIGLSLDAVYRGEQLSLSADDLDITLGGTDIMDRVTMESGSEASIEMPSQDPGTYELAVMLDRDGVPSAEKTFTVEYPVTITGAFMDRDNEPVSYAIEFSQDGQRKARETGNGEYRTQLVPGTYNVTVEFRDATITFRNVEVSDWENPIRYRTYGAEALSGLTLAGLYSYRTSISYDTAELSLQYDGGAVNDPDSLAVYRCSGWNSDSSTCYGSWSEMSADRDDVSGRMQVQSAGDGAYAIGRRSTISITYAEDKLRSSYTPDQEVELSGRVKGVDGEKIANATVSLNVDGTDISSRTWTDEEGMFDFSFAVPEEAGQYTMTVDAEQSPYRASRTTIDFTVERPSNLNIIAPESVTASANTTKNVSIYVENTGYTTIAEIVPKTENIPFFKHIESDGRSLQPGESRAAPLTLQIPADASAKTHKATLRFGYGEEEASAVFGITVNELEDTASSEETASNTVSGMMSGSLPSLPSASTITQPLSDVEIPFKEVVFFIIMLQVGVVGLVLAKGHIQGDGRTQRDHVLRAVSDIKTEVGQAVAHQDSGAQEEYRFRRRNDGVERETVLRTMNHIKDQLASDR